MKILITGHTGFKGSWLTFLLKELGHDLYGYALPPLKKSLFNESGLSKLFTREKYGDIRDYQELLLSIKENSPDVIFHLAAQPLVRYSYSNPEDTFTVNVDGTLNILRAFDQSEATSDVVVITTDKVYRNDESGLPFTESDPLGGVDPYSTSKAMADLLTQSWSASISKKRITIARAGNVIGGGDFAADRLIPDLVRSIQENRKPVLRNPVSVRPWQHVLDCLNGYIHLLNAHKTVKQGSAWNFGPEHKDYRTVRDVTTQFHSNLNLAGWEEVALDSLHEAKFLTLDSNKAMSELNWYNRFDFEQAVRWTADWYKDYLEGKPAFEITNKQVSKFLSL
jgi:CDP-glucose 4,6-dehydratase